MIRRDAEETEKRGFLDADSYVHASRMHPGTNHRCVYLAGADVGEMRHEIYRRDKGQCQLKIACTGVRVLPFDGDIYTRAHLEHKEGGLGLQRCDCSENLRISCYACHVLRHGREPWGKTSRNAQRNQATRP